MYTALLTSLLRRVFFVKFWLTFSENWELQLFSNTTTPGAGE